MRFHKVSFQEKCSRTEWILLVLFLLRFLLSLVSLVLSVLNFYVYEENVTKLSVDNLISIVTELTTVSFYVVVVVV